MIYSIFNQNTSKTGLNNSKLFTALTHTLEAERVLNCHKMMEKCERSGAYQSRQGEEKRGT